MNAVGRRVVLVVPAAAFALLLTVSCSGLPGTELGTYQVTGTLQGTNTCGGSPPNPWSFNVEMSRQASTLYWSWLDGSPLLSGALSSASAVTLTATTQSNVDGVDGGLGPCWLERDDSIAITLATGSPPATFTGTIGYTFLVVSGSDCADQIADGNYATLPCSLTYAVSATRQ
jgi:hypothetical protein